MKDIKESNLLIAKATKAAVLTINTECKLINTHPGLAILVEILNPKTRWLYNPINDEIYPIYVEDSAFEDNASPDWIYVFNSKELMKNLIKITKDNVKKS